MWDVGDVARRRKMKREESVDEKINNRRVEAKGPSQAMTAGQKDSSQ